jgi:RNA polymerase sigma-70 factor (ECF subfamily)
MTLERIYQEHFAFVWRALRRLGVREADCPDVAQEVFLVVHRKLGEFQGQSQITTWLFGICLRVARDRQRRAYVRREVSDDEALAAHLDDRSDVAAQAEQREALAQFEDILDGLDIEQRVSFTLFELEGLSCEQIAELTAVPVGTVYSRLRLAREAFKKAMGRLQAREKTEMAFPTRRRA